MMSIINRNQSLSDRLLDIALRERQTQAPAPVVVQQPAPVVQQPVAPPPSNDSALKPMMERIDSLISALAAAKQQPQMAPAPVVVTAAAPPLQVQQQAPAENAETTRMREELKKQKEELEAECMRVKDMQEKLKQSEIERHRRRLYPDYYAQEDARRAAAAAQQEAISKSADAPIPQASVRPIPASVPAQKKVAPKPAPAASESPKVAVTPLKDLKPIDYFKQKPDAPAKAAAEPPKAPSESQKPRAEAKSPAKGKAASVPAKATPPQKKQQPSSPAKKQEAPPPSAPQLKTETLNVGASANGSTPWLIEQQDL